MVYVSAESPPPSPPPPEPPQHAPEATAAAEGEEAEVWFEVSPTTGRLHLHGAADGSAPLGLSLPPETLLARAGPSPLLEDLLDEVDRR